MQVAKLSTGQIVRLLKPAQTVAFAPGRFILVCDRLTTVPSRVIPRWVPATSLVWVLDFSRQVADREARKIENC